MSTSNPLDELSSSTERAAAAVAPSIVQVHGRPRRPASGVAIAPDRVVTTSHSVEWDDHTRVRTASGAVHQAQVAGRDAQLDLVLLRVPGLDAAPAGIADAVPGTGALGLVVGRNWSGHLRARLTTVSRLDGPVRVGRGTTLDQVLALDVGVFNGFSGSALIRADGQLSGLATAGIVQGQALAVPCDLLRRSIEEMERHGTVKRGFLGISSQPVRIPERQRGQRPESTGLLVVTIAPGAPADSAGLLVGDILVGFDGTAIDEPEALLAQLSPARVGTTVPLTVLRAGTATEVPITVGERPAGHE